MNKIVIDSDISYWGYSARWLRSKLDGISGDVEVEISSYGGDVFEGIAMYNMLRNYDKTKGEVTTLVGSHAMSIASLLFLAGRKKKAHENSTIMIHKAWTWLAGNADELEAEARVLSGIDAVLANTYSKYMKKDQEEILKVMSSEGWYTGKDQLISTGFIDEFIISTEEVDVAAKSNFKSAMDRFSAKAKEEGVRPNLDEVKVAILECNDGQCPMVNLATMPSDSEKIVNNTKGATMEFNEDNFKVLLANKETLDRRMESFKMQLETATAALETKDEEIKALSAEMTSKLSEANEARKNEREVVLARLKEASATKVDVDTAMKMLQASSEEEASKIALDAKSNTNALNQGEGSQKTSPWNQFIKKDK